MMVSFEPLSNLMFHVAKYRPLCPIKPLLLPNPLRAKKKMAINVAATTQCGGMVPRAKDASLAIATALNFNS